MSRRDWACVQGVYHVPNLNSGVDGSGGEFGGGVGGACISEVALEAHDVSLQVGCHVWRLGLDTGCGIWTRSGRLWKMPGQEEQANLPG